MADAGAAPRRTRRENGSGSFWQRADGSWGARVVVAWRAKPVTASGKTREAARQQLRQRVRDAEAGREPTRTAERATVADYVARWRETKARLRRETVLKYDWAAGYVVRGLGDRPLRDVRPSELEAFYGAARATGLPKAGTRGTRGLGPRSVAYLRAVLRQVYALAVVDGVVPRNLGSAVKVDPVPPPAHRPLTPAECARLRAEAARHRKYHGPDRLRHLWTLLMYQGLRLGEGLGLTWDRVDLDAGRIDVVVKKEREQGQRARRDPHAPVLSPVKTAAGRRGLPLAPPVRAALRAQWEAQAADRRAYGAAYEDHGLVFATARGRPVAHRNAERAFERLARAAGLPTGRPDGVTPHALRHTAGSNLAAAGVDAATIAAILGHASAAFAMSTYVTPLADMKAAAVRRLSERLGAADHAAPHASTADPVAVPAAG